MKIVRKIELECFALPLVLKGIPHQIGRKWFWKVREDKKLHGKDFNSFTLRRWH